MVLAISIAFNNSGVLTQPVIIATPVKKYAAQAERNWSMREASTAVWITVGGGRKMVSFVARGTVAPMV